MLFLIVEDEFTSQKILKRILDKFGSCQLAEDGREILNHYISSVEKDEPYSAIFLDLNMPGCDGRTVLTQIRNWEDSHGIHGKDKVKIIITTSSNTSEEILMAFRMGCEDYLIKPLSLPKVVSSLEKLFERSLQAL